MADYQLEIHHLDVSGGDATIILTRKLENGLTSIVHSILIDTGGVGSGPKKVEAYISKYLPAITFNLFIASHYHDDHIKGLSYADLQGNNFIKADEILDIGTKADHFFPGKRSVIDERLLRRPKYIKKYFDFSSGFEDDNYRFFDFMVNDNYDFDEENKVYKPKTIFQDPIIAIMDDKIDTGFEIEFWSAKGVTKDGVDIIGNQRKSKSDKNKKVNIKIDANDLSISFTIQNKKTGFSYFSGGDLSGDLNLKEYYNVEGHALTLIASKFPDGIKVVKATHHGSDRNNHKRKKDSKPHNLSPGFFETLKPETIIIPCNQAKNVPGENFIKLLYGKLSDGTDKMNAYFINNLLYGCKTEVGYEMSLIVHDKPSLTNLINNGTITIEPLSAVIVYTTTLNDKSITISETVKPDLDMNGAYAGSNYIVCRNKKILVESNAYTLGGKLRLPDRILQILLEDDVDDNLPEGLRKGVLSQFDVQAEEMINKLTNAKSNVERKEFAAIIEEDYPSLWPFLNDKTDEMLNMEKNTIKTDMVKKMKFMLLDKKKGFYTRDKIETDKNKMFWYLNPVNDYNDDEELTLISLMVGNLQQLRFTVLENTKSSVFGDLSSFNLNPWDEDLSEDAEGFLEKLFLKVKKIRKPKSKDKISKSKEMKKYLAKGVKIRTKKKIINE